MPFTDPPQIGNWSTKVQAWIPFDKKPGANYVQDHIPIPGTEPQKYLKVTVFIDQKTLLTATPEQIEAKLNLTKQTLLAAWQLAPTTGEFNKIYLKSFQSDEVQYWKGDELTLNTRLRVLTPTGLCTEEGEADKARAIRDLTQFLDELPPEKVSTLKKIKDIFSQIFPARSNEEDELLARAELDRDMPDSANDESSAEDERISSASSRSSSTSSISSEGSRRERMFPPDEE